MQRDPCESSMAASTTAWHCSEGPVGPQQLALDFMAFKSKKSLLSSQGAWSYKYSGNDLPCFWICFGRVLCAITGWNPAGGRSGSGCRYVSGWPGPDPEFVRSPRPSCSRWMAPTPAWRPAGHLRHKWHDARRKWTFNVKENSFQICHPQGLGKNVTVGRFSIIVCESLFGICVMSVFSFDIQGWYFEIQYSVITPLHQHCSFMAPRFFEKFWNEMKKYKRFGIKVSRITFYIHKIMYWIHQIWTPR